MRTAIVATMVILTFAGLALHGVWRMRNHAPKYEGQPVVVWGTENTGIGKDALNGLAACLSDKTCVTHFGPDETK